MGIDHADCCNATVSAPGAMSSVVRCLRNAQVFYVLEKPPAEWSGGKGYISKDMVHEHLPLPHEGVVTLRCGPPPMNRAVENILDASGFTKEMQFEFCPCWGLH